MRRQLIAILLPLSMLAALCFCNELVSAHPLCINFGSCRSNETSAISLFYHIAVNVVVVVIEYVAAVIIYTTYKQPTNAL